VPVAPDRVKGLSSGILVLAVPPRSRLLLVVTLPLQVVVTLALLRGWLKAASFLGSSTVLVSPRSSPVRLYSLAIRGADIVRQHGGKEFFDTLGLCGLGLLPEFVDSVVIF
jgi:hypothetical protein